MVVAGAGEGVDLFEALRFAYRSLEFHFFGQLVVPDTGYVFGDEVSPCRFGNGCACSGLYSLRDGVSAHSGMVSEDCCGFCSGDCIFWPFLYLNLVCCWCGSGDGFVVRFVCRCGNECFSGIFVDIRMGVVLNDGMGTSEGPGFRLALKISRFYLEIECC